MDFKTFLIERISNTKNEADIILHQIFNNLDESHVDYEHERLDFNVGIMIKRSAYSKLYVTVIAANKTSVKLAKNNSRDGFTIVIHTTDYPKRMEIDSFLSSKGIYNKVKEVLINFIDNYQENDDEFRTTYEDNKQINTDATFERLYNEVIAAVKKRVNEYEKIAQDIENDIESTADEGRKQTLIRSLETLKDEYFGNTFKKFKKIASEVIDVDMTRFQKEYKKKFDTRLEDFYEYLVKKY